MQAKQENQYDTTKRMLEIIREGKTRIDEAEEPESVPYASNDDIFTEIKQVTQQQFGADYSGIPTPMLYHPKTGDITLVGKIQGLGEDMKFQFKYLDGEDNGCKILSASTSLNGSTMLKLQRIYGVFKNWIRSLNAIEDRKPLSYRGKQEPQQKRTLQPGDDRELI